MASGGNSKDWLAHPSFAWFRWTVVGVFALLAIAWLPGMQISKHLIDGGRLETNAYPALAAPESLLPAESALRADIAKAVLAPACAFAVWPAPDDSGFFGISSTSAADVRRTHDEAFKLVGELASSLNGQCAPKLDAAQINAAEDALAALTSIAQVQKKYRGVVVYHRALLEFWRGSLTDAGNDLSRLFEVVENDLNAGSRTPETVKRADSVKVAALYLRGAVALRSGATPAANAAAAMADFREAIKIASRLQAQKGPTRQTMFAELEQGEHVLTLSTRPIRNDLIYALALASEDGIAKAIAEARRKSGGGGKDEDMFNAPSDVAPEPALSATVMLLIAAEPGPLDNAALNAKRQLIERHHASMMARRQAEPNPAVVAALQRANIARVLVGLPAAGAPGQGGSGSPKSPVRTAFEERNPPPARPSGATSLFPAFEAAQAAGKAAALDAYLWLNEWRRLLSQGRLAQFAGSYGFAVGKPGIDAALFAQWRSEALAPVRQAARRDNLDPDARVIACTSTHDAVGPMAQLKAFECQYGGLLAWPILALWGLGMLAAVAFLLTVKSYARTFAPYHHADRMKRGGRR